MSVRPSTSSPRICSGDMYATVPTMMPAAVDTWARVGSSMVGPERVGRRELGQPEIEHLHQAVGPDHHVLGLQIAVDDAEGVRGADAGGDLNAEVEHLAQRRRRVLRREPLPERRALDVLHRDEAAAVIGGAQRVDDADVGMAERQTPTAPRARSGRPGARPR